MTATEATLVMLHRHVREGTRHVANQRAVIARLKRNGLPTDKAEDLLDLFQDLQRLHEAHLSYVQASEARGADTPDPS